MRCRNCQLVIPASAKFCAYCGTATAPAPPPPAPQPAGLLGRIGSYVAAHKVQTFGAAAFAAIGLFAIVLLLSRIGGDEPPPPHADCPARRDSGACFALLSAQAAAARDDTKRAAQYCRDSHKFRHRNGVHRA